MAENAVLVEGDTPRRFQMGLYAWPAGDAIAQRGDKRKAWLKPCHRARESVAKVGNELKQRQVGVPGPAPDEIAVTVRVALEDPLQS
jgi:hypothetical protein